MKKGRISKADEWLMTGTAIFFDALASLFGLLDFILPPIGTFFSVVVTWFGFGVMGLWFAMRRVSLFNNQKKFLTFFGSLGIEVIPYINLIPAVTFFTLRTIFITKLEDKQNSNAALSKMKAIATKKAGGQNYQFPRNPQVQSENNDVRRAA